MNQAPVIVTGEEFGAGLSFSDLRKKAQEHLRQLRGKNLKMADGSQLFVDRKGSEKPVSNIRKPEELQALAKIEDIARIAAYKGCKPDTERRLDIVAWHYYTAPVEIVGKTHAVTIVARELNDGKRFYDSHILEKNEPGA